MSAWIQLLGSGLLVVSLMFAAGLQLQVRDLLALRESPRLLALALVLNLVAIPAIGWALLAALEVPAAVMLGLMLCIAAPGGPAAVLYANTAKADLAFTVSLTIVLPVIGVASTPLTLALVPSLPADLAIPIGPVIVALVGFQLLPLALGMVIRARRAELAQRLAGYAKTTANSTLGALVLVMLVLEGRTLLEISGRSWLAMIGTAVAAVTLGYLCALPNRDSARAGALVAISRNVSVSIMLAATFATDPMVHGTVLTFGLVAFVTPLLLALIWRRSSSAAPAPQT